MRRSVLILLATITSLSLPAQENRQPTGNANGNVYAIVVGISSYENPGIPALSFAHRDAEVFADYLTSKAGGSVPQENIRTLLNEKATYAAIYDALAWLLETCKENDLVYFYFSGHGDMENNTIYKLGFLLSYNSPRTNYLNSAVRIEDLNNFANTLSIKAKTKVVLITDACHSGDLAGKSFRASMLVGQQLRAFKEKEIRITSCAPDQLSVEDEGWGGGRGVFSYYLINGLQGDADLKKDGSVTLSEIRYYLDSVMATDALLAQKAHVQKPAITGNDKFTIAFIDSSVAINKSTRENPDPPIVLLKLLAKSPQAYLFEALEQHKVEEIFNFDLLDKYPSDEIPFAFLSMAGDSLGELLRQNQLHEISESLQQNPDALKRFTNKLVVLLSDRGQEVINDYLAGDEAELERRRYYNSSLTNYDNYPKMFSVALKLAQPGSYLADILKIKYHYFMGIAARLKMPLVKDPSALIAQALQSQLKAYALEKNAAYIQNELGVLYSAKNDLKKAESFFIRATQIAPTWSIPWSNLSGLYLERKELDKAMEAVKRSLEVQPGNQGGYVSLGMVYEQQKNLLLAEEYFRTSIELNTRHYFPFERLAYIYLKTTDYALADSFFYEADKRKKGYHFPNPKHMKFPKPMVDALTQDYFCKLDTLNIRPGDAMGNFAWGMLHFKRGNLQQAEMRLRNSLRADSTSPLAWHYLGKILYNQERWMEADVMFTHALTFYLERDLFYRYLNERMALRVTDSSRDCIRQVFEFNFYDGIHDHYFLASLSEKWGHFAAADMHYRYIIQKDSLYVGGYQKLWMLYEQLGRYADAEDVIKRFRNASRVAGQNALLAFYKRMIARFPVDKQTYYTAANFLYYLVAEKPGSFTWDHKIIRADSDTAELVNPFHTRTFDYPEKLPGTGEELMLAPEIVRPISEGIAFFLIADSLFEDDAVLAEINQKAGDLYIWQGLGKKAIPHYKRSVALQPGNADTRMKLIRTSALDYKMGDALSELDSLQVRSQLNFEMQMLMAKYTMHAARFADAVALLQMGARVYPYETVAPVELQARLHVLKENPREALLFYKKLLKLQPEDPHTLYSIARVHAQMRNENAALQTLQASIDKGFNYSWVVNADDSWKSYRLKSNWKTIIKKMTAKAY